MSFCVYCGAKLEPGQTFCHICGKPVEGAAPAPPKPQPVRPYSPTPTPAPAPAKKGGAGELLRGKPWIIAVAAALVVVIALACILPGVISSSGSGTYANAYRIYTVDDEKIVLDARGNSYKFGEDAQMGDSMALDGSVATVNDDFDDDGQYTLWLISGGKSTKIADEVRGSYMSIDGSTVIYYTDFDADEMTATLNTYDTASGKKAEIADEVSMYGSVMAISPNGKTLAFITDFDMMESTFETHIYKNGKVEEYEDDRLIFGIADNAKYIYYYEYNADDFTADLYVASGKEEVKLVSDSAISNSTAYFNRDLSELIFSDGGKTYITAKGGEKIKLTGKELGSIPYPYTAPSAYSSIFDLYTYDVASFAGRVIEAEDTLYYISNKFETSKIDSDIYDISVSDDGKWVAYLDFDDTLYRAKAAENGADSVTEICDGEDVSFFMMAGDGKSVYFTTYDEELFYAGGSFKEPVSIADDIDGSWLSGGFGCDGRFYFLEDYDGESGTLCVVKNGGKPERISGGGDAYYVSNDIMMQKFVMRFGCDFDGDVYDLYELKGGKLVKVLSEIEAYAY